VTDSQVTRPDPHSADPVKRLPAAVTQRSSTDAELAVIAGLYSEGGEER
jgi:hypothetical protein